VDVLSACSTTYIFKYMGVDTLIVSIALLLFLLNIWVWFIYEDERKIKLKDDLISIQRKLPTEKIIILAFFTK